MRSFLATSNHQYVQDIVLKPGQYTFSALVKSAGSYAFALMIGGVWIKYDVPTSTTNWRKLKHTFTTDALATKFSLVADYASAGTPIEVLTPMFEEGSIVSTARMHELDVLEAIAIAKTEAETAAKAHADAKSALAETNAKAYADGEVDAAEARAIAEAQAKVDAQAAIDLAARNSLKTTLEAYADGVVDAEEAARIADANAKLAEAKQHAENLDAAIEAALDALTNRVNAEELAVIALENKTGAFAEPSINPAENTLLAGSMLVGNSSGTNAGLSGMGSLPTSVRLWAGGSFANRATANWLMRDDGVEERWMTYNSVRVIIERRGYFNNVYSHTIYNPADGSIAKRTTVQSGFTTEEWYKDGVLQYEIGRNGIYYVSEIAESYTLKRLVNLSSNTATSDLTIFHNTIRTHMWQKTSNPNQFELRGNKDAYLYSAGRNVYSESNKQYEGYKNTQSLSDNITDGWYAFEQLGMMMEDGVDQTKKLVNLIRVQGGKAVQSGTTAVETTGYYFNQF